MNAPADFQRRIGTLFYKIGLRDFLFVWDPDNQEWKRSGRTVEEFYQKGVLRKEIQEHKGE